MVLDSCLYSKVIQKPSQTKGLRDPECAVQKPLWAARESSWQIKIDPWGPEWEPWTWIGSLMSTRNEGYSDGLERYEIDELCDKCKVVLDFDERVEPILELGQYFYERYLVGPITVTSRVFALSPKMEYWPMDIPPWEYKFGRYEYATRAD